MDKAKRRPWEEYVEGMQVIYATWTDQYRIHYEPDVVYAIKRQPLRMQMLTMRNPIPGKRYPAIVYVTGSGWQKQDIYDRLPQLVEIARQGYVVASIEYRNTDDGYRFPSQIEDAKSAIRFLRENAAEYGIDPERIGIWGDSSGGHTALMAAYTSDDEFSAPDDPDQTAKVTCVVDFFAPVELETMDSDWTDDFAATVGFWNPGDPLYALFGGGPQQKAEQIAMANPKRYIDRAKSLPATLIVHGDHDTTVHLRQSATLYQALREAGQQADMFVVKNAAHGFQFWTKNTLEVVTRFFKAWL